MIICRYRDITWVNSIYKSQSTWAHQHELLDIDGTLTLSAPGSTVLTASNLLPSTCVHSDEWTTRFDSVICPPGDDFIRATFSSYEPFQMTFQDLIATNNAGNPEHLVYGKQRSTNPAGHMLVAPAGREGAENVLNIEFEGASQVVNISYFATFIGVGVSRDSSMIIQ